MERVKAFGWGITAIAGIVSQPYLGQISWLSALVGDLWMMTGFFIIGWLLSNGYRQ